MLLTGITDMIARQTMKINAKQILRINKCGLTFDDRETTWNVFEGDWYAVTLKEDYVIVRVFREDGNYLEERREFSNDGWETEGWEQGD